MKSEKETQKMMYYEFYANKFYFDIVNITLKRNYV